MGFLNSDSLPYLVEKLTDGANIKIAGNNKGDRVSTVVSKISEKAKDVTKATFQKVTNTSTTFRTGTGNVDVSATMEDGFSNIGIRGKTYQNLVDSYRVHYDMHSHTCNFKNGMVKPNTTYTAVIINTCNQDLALYWNEYTFRYKEIKSVPINSYFITSNVSKEEVSDSTLFKNLKIHSTDFDYSYKVILLEGDLVEELTNNPLPYFEGMKSVGEPTLDGKYEIEIISTGNIGNMQDTISNTPHNSNKAKILLDEPLRKIKNFVYDELLEDGTLIRRCGEVELESILRYRF